MGEIDGRRVKVNPPLKTESVVQSSRNSKVSPLSDANTMQERKRKFENLSESWENRRGIMMKASQVGLLLRQKNVHKIAENKPVIPAFHLNQLVTRGHSGHEPKYSAGKVIFHKSRSTLRLYAK
ncbi:unnamed protein product [Sphenostylis stenocarpa]|uniref:Uncharacterized protein n=1 Tax=Sphenostylis stenocarpa TaxID=92480 RepID=A0AA86VXQ0_9FABA|nr:unnamed protein product [Sphenostylis stenocarpa]